MSLYVLAPNGVVQKYPYNAVDLRRDNPQVSFPAAPVDALLAEWGVYPVTAMLPPNYDPKVERLSEQPPAMVFGSWEQTWAVVPLTADEIAERNKQIREEIVAQVQNRLDTFAQTKGYDNIVSACSYATSSHAKYGPEGRYCVSAREATWDALFAIESDVIAGTRPMPQNYDEIAGELPALSWPI
jgi:hypothetical protein